LLDSVLDHLTHLKKRVKNETELKELAAAYLVGQVVLTRYDF